MILMNQYLICKNQQLGKGSTGEVYLGRCLKNHSNVAIKIIDLKTIDNQVSEYLLNMEKTALMTINNPHILKGIRIVQDELNCYLITELCNGGTLKDFIKANGPLGDQKSMQIFIQIIKGECSLIEKGILHRDLKPTNILIHNGQTKIIDFGYSSIKGFKKPSLHYNVGSPSYMSPEAFLNNQYSQKSEIWAAGVTLYECLNGKTFDEGKHMSQVYKNLKKHGIPFKTSVNKRIKSILEWCFQPDPQNRPNFIELLNFISQTNLQKSIIRASAQSGNDYVKSIKQIEYKSSNKIQSKCNPIKIWVKQYTDQLLSKENVLKQSILENRNRFTSGYENTKMICDKKLLERPSLLSTRHTKYERYLFQNAQNKTLGFTKQYYEKQLQNGQNNDPISNANEKIAHDFNTIRTKIASRPYQKGFLSKTCYETVTRR